MRTRRVLAALALAGIVSSFFVVAQRVPAMDPGRRVEVAVDLNDARELARTTGVDPDAFLRALGRAGATTLGIGPTTVGQLVEEGRITVLEGSEALGLGIVGAAAGAGSAAWLDEARPEACYLLAGDRSTAEWVGGRLDRLGYPCAAPFSVARGWAVAVGTDARLLPRAALGFDLAWDAAAHRLGLRGMGALGRPERVVPGTASLLLEGLRQAGQTGTALLWAGNRDPEAGPAVGGAYGEWFSQVDEALPTGWRLVALEGRLGEPELAAAVGGPGGGSRQWVRGHVIEPKEPVADLVDAVRDRGMRLFYLRPFGRQGSGWDSLQPSLDLVRGLCSELAAAGYEMGPATGPARLAPPWWGLVLAALGVEAALGLLLLELGAGKRVVWALAAPALAVAALCGLSPWALEAMALVAACVFPALGCVWLWGRFVESGGVMAGKAANGGRPAGQAAVLPALVRALGALALAAVASLAGGLVITALLGDTSYALGLRAFKGVKVAYLAPLAVVAAGAWLRPVGAAREGSPAGRRNLWWRRVTVLDLVWLLVLGGLLYVYVSRSGQTGGAPVAALELKVRHWLEAVFLARPRTKEFLFGHPLLVLGFWLLGLGAAGWSGAARWAWLGVTAGAVGQASLVNCFAHLHAPFVRSVVRSLAGLALGAAVGVVLVLAVWAVARACGAARRPGRDVAGAGGAGRGSTGLDCPGAALGLRALTVSTVPARAGKEAHRRCGEV